ncbi:GNAT family N-acetyltransferase [Gordonia sp. PDNC005]|uniref:GNAT family N-acetyltransferase n=1 Tax=unclassified Gordonia (in: high G+C Gram-positive bacteria) TaxID=2657482 RepID=UPI0019624BA6|nr:GNAT family N-acetyltransferase [Gordonia sp. PDNC005]QRY60889.1 GNAT family N-acetyltransferase [Gordonia sp. PDNC005]
MRLCHTHELADDDRSALFSFLDEAFEHDFEASDFDHALGGVHVIAEDADGVVGHAAVVQRQLVAGDDVYRVGYVEAVAVASRMRRRGIGEALMSRIDEIVRSAYDLGALGASDDGMPLYLRRGWEPWTGPLGALTPNGVTMTPDDEGGVLILRTPSTVSIDTSARLLCDWRAGDVW